MEYNTGYGYKSISNRLSVPNIVNVVISIVTIKNNYNVSM